MHPAALIGSQALAGGHHEPVPRPEAGAFGVGITGRLEIAAIVAGIEGVVGRPPVGGNRAHRILDQVGCAGPLCQAHGGGKELQRLDESNQSLAPEPARTARGHMHARRKGEQDGNLPIRRQPIPHIRTDADNIPVPRFTGRMPKVHAVAEEAGLGPRLDHVSGVIEEADDDRLNHASAVNHGSFAWTAALSRRQ